MTETAPTHKYPGMGLPLRFWDPLDQHGHEGIWGKSIYPMGVRSEAFRHMSPLVYVREVAMMMVMEILTEKPEWHKKVFDDAIVAKWRKEALAIPDEVFWDQSTSFKTQHPADPDRLQGYVAPRLNSVGLMSEKAFDWVCLIDSSAQRTLYLPTVPPLISSLSSVLRSFGPRLATLRRRASLSRLILEPRLPSPTRSSPLRFMPNSKRPLRGSRLTRHRRPTGIPEPTRRSRIWCTLRCIR